MVAPLLVSDLAATTLPSKLPKLLQGPVDLPRRQFLTVAVAAPAAAACALLSRPRAAQAAAPVADNHVPDENLGYHETEHVRRYYRSAAYF